jgi:hypothetical protein
MGSLSNLYISQSFISLLHLASNNTASSTSTEIQDGLGNGIGITVNTAGDLFVGNQLTVGRAVTFSGSVKINTEFTSSTPTYVNSGNYFTDSIIRITGSFASGSAESPTVNEVQIGWPVYGNGLVSGAVVTNKQYVNSQFVELTINQNTAVWFGNYYFTNPSPQYINFSVSGSEDITGSLSVRDNLSVNNISASGNISASNLYVKGRISAYELDVTIESSSIIFTSGSNIIGDEANIDTQTLIGRVKVSGSLEVTGSTRLNGNVDSTGSLKVTSDISSSTISGIGNVTLFSQSVDSRLDLLENFSSSQYKADSASFQSQITTNSASFAAYSSSLVATFATNAFVLANTASLSASIYFTDSSQSVNITQASASAFGAFQSASAFSASAVTTYAKLNSNNTFVGNQTITGSLTISGSMVYSGSVRGQSFPITIVSNTASMDCSLGNFFTITLPSQSTNLVATNIQPGETLSLRITNETTSSTLILNSSIKFPTGFNYVPTNIINSTDIITFLSFDTASIYAVAANYFA